MLVGAKSSFQWLSFRWLKWSVGKVPSLLWGPEVWAFAPGQPDRVEGRQCSWRCTCWGILWWLVKCASCCLLGFSWSKHIGTLNVLFPAGDFVKFGFPMAGAMTQVAWGAISFQSGYEAAGQLDYLKARAIWIWSLRVEDEWNLSHVNHQGHVEMGDWLPHCCPHCPQWVCRASGRRLRRPRLLGQTGGDDNGTVWLSQCWFKWLKIELLS